MFWEILSIVLIVALIVLAIAYALLRRAFDEITDGVKERANGQTSTPITLSSTDQKARKAAVVLNEELRELFDEKRKMENSTLEINRAVTNVSHDLRTPLTAINSYLDLLETEKDEETRRMYLQRIKNRTDVMVGLTDELFKYSFAGAASSAGSSSADEACDIRNITSECLLSFYESFKSSGIEPEVMLPESSVMAKISSSDANRIVENIISNGLKYAERSFDVKLSKEGVLTFSNYAPSLSQIDVKRMFDRYYTVQHSASSTGLGLSIARELLSKNSGSIDASLSDDNLLTITVKFETL